MTNSVTRLTTTQKQTKLKHYNPNNTFEINGNEDSIKHIQTSCTVQSNFFDLARFRRRN